MTDSVVASRYRLEVRGRVPAGVVGEIDRRYGPVSLAVCGRRTMLEGAAADQAALRGLLTLLWDVNTEVLRFEVDGGD